jgi:subfamily B ATP-binding cassette protein MsbA
MSYVGNRVVADIRLKLFQHLMQLPVGYHDANTSGRLVSRVLNDVSLMASAVSNVLRDLFQHSLTFLVMLGVVFYQNWKLASLSIVVIPLSVVTMSRMGRRLRALATKGQERMGDMSSTIQEVLSGIRMVKAYKREEAEAKRFAASNQAFLSTTLKSNQVWSISSSYMEVIGVIGVAVIIWYGGYLVIHETLTPGAFFSAAMFVAFTPVRKLAGSNNLIQQALAAAERVYEVLDIPTEGDLDQGTIECRGIRQGLELQGVSLSYTGQTTAALSGVNLSIRAGEMVALVGSSGSGKSTLVSLLPRFYQPTNGQILLDGAPLESYLLHRCARRSVSSRRMWLFDDTVATISLSDVPVRPPWKSNRLPGRRTHMILFPVCLMVIRRRSASGG